MTIFWIIFQSLCYILHNYDFVCNDVFYVSLIFDSNSWNPPRISSIGSAAAAGSLFIYLIFSIEFRHSTQPKELIVETISNYERTELEKTILQRVEQLYNYLKDHRYDPTEYYGEQDYLKEIPDPCNEPLAVMEEFIDIIHNFGLLTLTAVIIILVNLSCLW